MSNKEITRELWVKYRKAKSDFVSSDKDVEFHMAQAAAAERRRDAQLYLIALYKTQLQSFGEDVSEE